MTKDEFMLQYAELISYYQLIEMRLKGICAALLADDNDIWYNQLLEQEAEPFGALLKKIRTLQTQTQKTALSQEDLAALDELRKTRNYWVHLCFVANVNSIVFTYGKNPELKNPTHAPKLNRALSDAIEWDEKLTEVARQVIPLNRC